MSGGVHEGETEYLYTCHQVTELSVGDRAWRRRSFVCCYCSRLWPGMLTFERTLLCARIHLALRPVDIDAMRWIHSGLPQYLWYSEVSISIPSLRIYFEILRITVTWIMINTTVMLDSVLSPANFARDYVPIQTIFMACKATLFISAGSSMDRPSYIT